MLLRVLSCSILVSASRLSLCFGLISLELFFFNSNIQGCFMASSAFKRVAGSHLYLKKKKKLQKNITKKKKKLSSLTQDIWKQNL